MPRHQNQTGRRKPRAQPAVHRQSHRLLAAVGAGRDPHRGRAHAPAPCERGDTCPMIHRQSRIELDAAVHRHPRGQRAQRLEASGMLRILTADPAQALQHGPGERAEPGVTASRALRHPGVHQHHRNAAGSGLANRVRPQLRLHQYQQPRLQRLVETPYRPRKVIADVAMMNLPAETLGHLRRSAGRHGRDQERLPRKRPAQRRQQRRRRDDLAGAHRVEPHASGRYGRRDAAQPLRHALAVGGLAPCPPAQAHMHPRPRRPQQRGVYGSPHGRRLRRAEAMRKSRDGRIGQPTPVAQNAGNAAVSHLPLS